jgi:hypothetical protein
MKTRVARALFPQDQETTDEEELQQHPTTVALKCASTLRRSCASQIARYVPVPSKALRLHTTRAIQTGFCRGLQA